MSEQNTEFENWYNNKLAECRTNNDMVLHKKLFQYTDFYKHGYEAATAEANKRIAELEGEVNYLKSGIAEELEQRILELQADNNDLREALKTIAIESHEELWQREFAFKALSATPAESLQAHDDELIEKCAKVCDGYIGQECLANDIRALKQK